MYQYQKNTMYNYCNRKAKGFVALCNFLYLNFSSLPASRGKKRQGTAAQGSVKRLGEACILPVALYSLADCAMIEGRKEGVYA